MLKRTIILGVAIAIFALPALHEVAAEGFKTKADATIIEPAQNSSTQSEYVSPVEQTGAYGNADHNNIGILIAFGTGNTVTPDQAGEWATKKLKAYAAEQGKSYDTQYFVLHTDKGEGIAISYHVAVGQGVGPKDIMEAKNPTVLDEVFQKRDMTARLLKQ